MRILVVEDDKDVAGFVVRGLREAGHVVEHADNGRDGMFLAASESFDAVILDRMLPGGIDVHAGLIGELNAVVGGLDVEGDLNATANLARTGADGSDTLRGSDLTTGAASLSVSGQVTASIDVSVWVGIRISLPFGLGDIDLIRMQCCLCQDRYSFG